MILLSLDFFICKMELIIPNDAVVIVMYVKHCSKGYLGVPGGLITGMYTL
jgi:hypothetical protein